MILLVDDDKEILNTYKKLLELSGYHVSAHSNPESALNSFEAQPSQFKAIITDFHMPEMDGLKLIQQVHTKKPNIKSILYSGMPPSNVPDKITILKKPSVFKHLLSELAMI